MSKYSGMQANRICPTGGAVRVTLGTTTDNRGNGGTSLPCKGCWVQAVDANTDVVRMNIGAAATDDLGIDLAWQHVVNDASDGGYGIGASQPIWVPVDDVADLYFYSGDTDGKVDILYLLG